ncbi:MamL-1 domain protein [Ancylostoma ceylanicum]|uniref:MamL-1 domain protein n=1 Tax=Ancylostoma ceylanicum TaxID=53326 RepID=A0A0D6LR73_9BILA|nr:MamL-1 domain protein [Ancylostoma ceylanicum]
MQVALMSGQSPSSTLNGNASTPDPPVPSSDGDRLRASMEAWKRSAALASERYGEARQRQIAAERDDRQELRKRWLEEEAKKRAESVGKHKDVMSTNTLTPNMPPPLYQSTPINNRDSRKRHLDTNDYGHEEWRQGFRMMEGCGMSDMTKSSADDYPNMTYPPSGAGFYPGMMRGPVSLARQCPSSDDLYFLALHLNRGFIIKPTVPFHGVASIPDFFGFYSCLTSTAATDTVFWSGFYAV